MSAIFYRSDFEMCKWACRVVHMARDVNETTTRKMFGFGISNADVDDFAFF
jgi:hypothetical protein